MTLNFTFIEGVGHINGSLRIEHSDGLIIFNFLPKLENITNEGTGPALVIQENSNLSYFDLPSLRSIYSNSTPWVVVQNNPKLELNTKFRNFLRTLEEDQKQIDTNDTSVLTDKFQNSTSDVELTANGRLTSFDEIEISVAYKKLILVSVPLLIIMLAFCGALLWAIRKKMRPSILPPPNYRLSPKAQVILLSICQDVLLTSPLTWKFEERRLLWPQNENGCARPEFLQKVHTNYVNNHVLPLGTNAVLPTTSDNVANPARTQYLIFERVRSILKPKSAVVVIGTETDPRCAIPDIPVVLGQKHMYENGSFQITLYLSHVQYVGKRVQDYEYSVISKLESGIMEKSTLRLVFVPWDSLAMGPDVQETLQLVQFCRNAKESICVSDRHKEIFSLLHLFYSFIVTTETPISLSDAFQLHTATCNGFMVDRMEMLFAMNFLLVWAASSKVLSRNLQKSARQWMDTYRQMEGFRRLYPNMITVHPDHLSEISEQVVMEIARAGGFPPPRFSCREDSVMADKFVFRANVLVEETDLERKAREGGLKRLKFSESEKKEKEQEETETTTNGTKLNDDDAVTFGHRKYRGGRFRELLKAEQRQIKALMEKRRAKKLSEYSVQLSAEAATAIPPRPQSQEPLKDDDSQPTQEESSLRQILRPPEMRNTVSAPAILLQPALTGKSKSKNLFAKIRKFASRKVAVLAGKKTTSPTYTQSPSLKKGSISLSQKTVSKANTPDKPGEAKKSVRTLNHPNERAAHSVSPPQRNSKQQPVSITEHSMRQKRTCELRRLSAESVKNSAEDIHERSPVKKASAGSKDTEQITQKSTQKSSHKANKRKSKPVRSKSSPAKFRKRVKHTKAAGIMRRILRRHKSMPSVSAPTR